MTGLKVNGNIEVKKEKMTRKRNTGLRPEVLRL